MVSVLDLGEGRLSPLLTFRSWTEAHKALTRPQGAFLWLWRWGAPLHPISKAREKCPGDEVEQGQEKT